MIVRAIALGALVSMFGAAPFQCAHEPDPNVRREDTAGDALWALAEKFKAEHNDAAAKETLRFLVDKYPSNRHAAAAREELGLDAGHAAAQPSAPDR